MNQKNIEIEKISLKKEELKIFIVLIIFVLGINIISIYKSITANNQKNNDIESVISGDGKYKMILVQKGILYTSSDYGNTWTPVDPNNFGDGGYENVSSNYGATWLPVRFNSSIFNVLDDGKYIMINNDIDISNWKTYTNNKYNYQIKYPEDIYTIENIVSKPENRVTDNHIVLYDIKSVQKTKKCECGEYTAININVYSNPQGLSLENYIKENIRDSELFIKEQTNLNGIPAIKIDFEREQYYFLEKNNNIFSIGGYLDMDIINTFKFINEETDKTIKITSPNENEIWKIGNTYDITWQSSEKEGNAYIYLWGIDGYKCNHACTCFIGSASVSANKYSWKIDLNSLIKCPTNPKEGKYKISIILDKFWDDWDNRTKYTNISDNYFDIIK